MWLITSNLDENLRFKNLIENLVNNFYKENVDITIIGLAKWSIEIQKRKVSVSIKLIEIFRVHDQCGTQQEILSSQF